MKKRRILIIDYKVGNCQSVANSLDYLGYTFFISSKKEDIIKADSYILPGVGAFPEAMRNLKRLNIEAPLFEHVMKKKKPILGICLGMQVLAESSEEGGMHSGLGWIEGKVVKFKETTDIRIPHVGWNNIKVIKSTPLFTLTGKNSNFYFDHSFYIDCPSSYVAAQCSYGINFTAVIQKNNIFG